MRFWKWKVRSDFNKWVERNKDGWNKKRREAILKAGEKALWKADQCSWWVWDKGSCIFFWRWPEHYQDIACKGHASMFDGEKPASMEG